MAESLVNVADGVWVIDHDHALMAVRLGLRTMVIDHGGGKLLLYSPGPLTDALADAISAVGEVTALVAPNGFHHLHIEAALAHFPAAKVYASPGIASRKIPLKVDETLGHSKPADWGDDVDMLLFDGAPHIDEVVLLHKPSGTLALCDVCMNVHNPHWFTGLFMRLNGRYKELGPTRFFKLQIKDKAAFGTSVEQMLAWDFDRVVVSHGEIVHSGGKAQLLSVFSQ